MYSINCKLELKDLSGKPLIDSDKKTLTIGKILSNILLTSKTGGKMKLFVLATKFYNDEVVQVDASDFNLIKEIVPKAEEFNALITGQIELILSELKEQK